MKNEDNATVRQTMSPRRTKARQTAAARLTAAGCALAAGAFFVLENSAPSGPLVAMGRLRDSRDLADAASATSEENATEHRIGADDAGIIWIVNQPKCGTGSLDTSFLKSLNCDVTDGSEYGSGHGFSETRFLHCDDGKKMVFRTHSADAHLVKRVVDEKMEAEGTKPEKCLAVTAVRDPLLSIPSLFFEKHREQYCDGSQDKEEILRTYDQFLLHNRGAKQVETTVAMLRAFGVEDILGAMEKLTEKGYAFFDEPEKDGPWAGCELLFLQIDYEESNDNINNGLDHAVEGVKMRPLRSREALCPKAVDNYHAIINHGIQDSHIDRFCLSNPEMCDVINYYKNRRNRS